MESDAEDIVNWKKCIICQDNKFPKKKFPISKGTGPGIERIIHCATIRERCEDTRYHCSRIVNSLKEKGSEDVLWHRTCYSSFTNEGHIRRLQSSGSGTEKEETPASRRASTSPIDWNKCMFCQSYNRKFPLNNVQTLQTSDKILRIVASGVDREMSCKLAGIHDLVAAEGKYHLRCYSSFLRKAKLSEGNQEDNGDQENNDDEEFDEDVSGHDDAIFGDATEDIDLHAEFLSWLYRVAIKVHHDVKSMPGHDCIGDISQESAEKIIPDSLFTLINLLCTGHQDDDGEDESCKTKVLSICQDIFFLASRGRKLTPKHVGLGLTIHQATRSKELVQLLYSAGHSVSYETVLRIDNTIANDVLEKYKNNGNVFVPRNFSRETTAEYTRYAVDNIDINEETLSGMGTFHATQVAAFRRKEEGEESGTEVRITPKSSRRLEVELPNQLHELDEVVVKNKPEPVNQEAKEEWYAPDKNKINESNKKELSWILGRLSQQRPELQKIPGWSGFNQLTTDKEPPEVTIVGPMPIINALAHEFETLWTVILRCKAMTALRGGKYTVVTMDEGLYNKAKMLQWEKTEEMKNVILILGGFHTQMTFSKVMGKFLESSGISDMWVESEVFGETTAGNILKGKLWNRVIRAHKLSYEALWRVLWPILLSWAKDEGKDPDGKLADLPAKFASGFTATDDKSSTTVDFPAYKLAMDEMGHVVDIIHEFDKAHQSNPTFCYWRQYMLLVSILLRFTRAIREGDWDLYLSCIAEMLPWFAAFDHVNYTRWASVFLSDMKALPHNAPEVHQAFQDGDFVTKETTTTFNQIPDDQALEHVNKTGKVAGGLVGITRTDSARDRWCLTYNERAQLSEDTKAMFGVVSGLNEGSIHKDLGKTRMKKDEEDVEKLVAQFSKYEVFRQTDNLVVVTTGDIASEEIEQDLLEAEQKGQSKLQDFVQERLISKDVKFHDPIKQQKLKTLETLYSVSVPVGNSKTVIKADRDLLRRVVVALESGRDVDVDALLKRELSPVPMSIATLDGCLRLATGKSDLGSILQENVSQSQPPQNQAKTCTIIDGMAAVQSLGNSAGAKTFGEYCDKFTNFVTSHFSEKCTRVDLVFDQYIPNSIKESARLKRKGGKTKGIRKDVESREQRIGSWDKFIVVEENKGSLAHFLSTEISERYEPHPPRELVVSGGFNAILRVWSSTREDLRGLSSSQEEADTRIVLHARDAAARGYKQVNVLCRDTDVLVLLLAHRHDLCDDVWMFSGTSRRKRFTPVHKIVIPEEKRKSLLAFHALTGCDTTSQFAGIGKATAWKVLDDQTASLIASIGEASPPSPRTLSDAEAFVCQLYHNGTREVEINRERAAAFRKVKKNLDTLPPTQDALHLHIRRANYQAMIWKRAQDATLSIRRPEDENGWYLSDEGILKPKLMTQEEVSASCLQLAFCGCSSENSCLNRRCTCVRLSLPCSKACKCSDTLRCRNPQNVAANDDIEDD